MISESTVPTTISTRRSTNLLFPRLTLVQRQGPIRANCKTISQSWTPSAARTASTNSVSEVNTTVSPSTRTSPRPSTASCSSFPLGDGFTDFQDFLLGKPGFSFGGSGVSNHEYRVNDYGLFIQDDYKATSDLTINAGLRWELFGAAKDNRCHIGNTISAWTDQGLSTFVYPKCVSKLGVPGFSGTLSDTTMANSYASDWGPRIGFAYDLFGHHTTSVRGGYGIFYVREDVGTVDQLSFTTPILPITTPTGTPGDMADIFAVGPGRLPTGGV